MIAETQYAQYAFEDDFRYESALWDDAKESGEQGKVMWDVEAKLRNLAILRIKEYRVVVASLRHVLETQDYPLLVGISDGGIVVNEDLIKARIEQLDNKIAELESMLVPIGA